MTPLSHRVFTLEQAAVHLIEFGHLVSYYGAPRAGARGSRQKDQRAADALGVTRWAYAAR